MSILHILCFGDSLTAGFSQYGTIYHPYAWSLQSSLESLLPSTTVINDIQGLSGDMVVYPLGRFLPRMEDLYTNPKMPYNWAVVLGGTNDLGRDQKADEIFDGLLKVWDIPLQQGTKVLALTVPECGVCSPVLDKRRDKLNNKILEYKAENYYTLDLHSAIPYWSMPEEQRNEIWDDGIHFTEAGYDLMGSIISDRIIQLILEPEGKPKDKELDQKPMQISEPNARDGTRDEQLLNG